MYQGMLRIAEMKVYKIILVVWEVYTLLTSFFRRFIFIICQRMKKMFTNKVLSLEIVLASSLEAVSINIYRNNFKSIPFIYIGC